MTMTVVIELNEEEEKKLRARASGSGQDLPGYIRRLIKKEIQTPTLSEILAPLRRQFEESGMTEDELDALVEEVREEVWQEKQERKAS